jgi:hypothetical protein
VVGSFIVVALLRLSPVGSREKEALTDDEEKATCVVVAVEKPSGTGTHNV